ncbi:MAG: VTT domain-containing protein [Anaerolineae bacterium]|nr:VTT domain-containing protein [Anaerolineae bacterium]
MEILTQLFDFVIHLDAHLAEMVDVLGVWAYLLLFAVVFVETGLVVALFLPSDSLIFVAGALAGLDVLNIVVLFFLFVTAAILGDSLNYFWGSLIGPRAFDGRYHYLKPEYLTRTQAFYDRHGGKAIILARFVPVMRCFVPLVAGLGAMEYGRFLPISIIGNIIWVSITLFSGYFFGAQPLVQKNFGLMLVGVFILSLMPAIIEFLRGKLSASRKKSPEAP